MRRFPSHYESTDEELRWIGERVAELQSLVQAVCERQLTETASTGVQLSVSKPAIFSGKFNQEMV
jgi:hypothetical protein